MCPVTFTYRSPTQDLKQFHTHDDTVKWDVLEQEMSNCRELLELEPDSKRTLLTLVLIAKSMDPIQHHNKILKLLNRLQEVDPKRRNYYADLRPKFIIEAALVVAFARPEKLTLSLKSLN